MNEDVFVATVTVTEENREALARIALSPYVGMACSLCGLVYESTEALEAANPVRSNAPPGPVEIACDSCWNARRGGEQDG